MLCPEAHFVYFLETLLQYHGWLSGVVIRNQIRDFPSWVRIPVMTLPRYFWDRWPSFTGKLSWDITTTQVNSALHLSGVAKSSTSFSWGKGGKFTAARWQVTLCDPIWHVISRSAEVHSWTAIFVPLHLRISTLSAWCCYLCRWLLVARHRHDIYCHHKHSLILTAMQGTDIFL